MSAMRSASSITTHLDLGHRDVLALDQVDQAARSGDDYVRALCEALGLRLDVGAPVHRDGPAAHGLGEGLEHLVAPAGRARVSARARVRRGARDGTYRAA